MQGIRINRNLVKALCCHDESLEHYRFYVMARNAWSDRSGLFSLDEFCDLLCTEYGYSSLHKKPGNKRNIYKRKFDDMFSASILFKKVGNDRFIANSERRLLVKERGSDKSSWYEIPDGTILKSKGLFYDFCIGALLAGNKFRANKNIATYCSCSVRRIQLATAANNKRHHFLKRYNFIDDYSGSRKKIEQVRGQLLAIHGITTPYPYRYKDEWVLRLNAPNSYKTYVLSGVKGYCAQPTSEIVRKKEYCWFLPIKQSSGRKSGKDIYQESKKWIFNGAVYDFDKYIADNSIYLS